jgi:hypothetical protein
MTRSIHPVLVIRRGHSNHSQFPTGLYLVLVMNC